MPLCGGTGAAKPADAEVQAVCDLVRADLEGKLNRKFDTFAAILVASQVVAGINYFVKIHLGNDEYLHARIYKHFSDGPKLHGVQYPKTKDEPVVYFAQD